jgi:hypothetical protein
LQYGLFHANAQPNKLFNAVTTGIAFKGVLMDIGHVRHNRWVKDSGLDTNSGINTDDPAELQRAIARAAEDTRKRWIAYNRMRGQYASALEHSVPERYFNDSAACNLDGASTTSTPPFDPAKPNCEQGISAVKTLTVAQSEGQKIFLVNQANFAEVIPFLSHRASVIDEIRATVSTGKEVTIHERAVTANGWSGAGYTVIDPENGAGAYLIEGGARGGFFKATVAAVLLMLLSTIAEAALAAVAGAGLIIGGLVFYLNNQIQKWFELTDFEKIIVGAVEVLATMALLFICAAVCPAAYGAVLLVGLIVSALAVAGSVMCYALKSFGADNLVSRTCAIFD